LPRAARAEIIDFPAPGPGCIDTVAGGVGLFEGVQTPSGGVVLDVPGDIVQVVVEWIGRDDLDRGVSSLDIAVTGPGGTASDPALAGTLSGSDTVRSDGTGATWYAWWGDITSLFTGGGAGTYTVDIAPFATPGRGVSWGAVVTVVYDTSPCSAPNELLWKTGADYYFGGDEVSDPTTDLIVYDWGTAFTEDTTMTLRVSHGGADSAAGACRVSTLWMATGSGTPPATSDDLVSEGGVPVHPAALEAVIDPFTPSNQPCPPPIISAPAVALRGGNVGPELALVEIDVVVPAGSEWLALQLESPRDNGGFVGTPESGSWGAAATLLVRPGTTAEPGIALEKTVLAGHGASCPGVEGVDEMLTTEVGAPVTYCLRVINTGNVALFPIDLSDATLDIDASAMTLVAGDDTVPLAPGGELVYAYETVASGDLVNVAVVTGTPSDDEGAPLDMEPVTDENDAAVETPAAGEPAAAILLEKTVLAGHGAACPGVEGVDERVTGVVGAPVTYCFRVINTGTDPLDPVTVVDDGLGVDDAVFELEAGSLPLAPGAEIVYSFDSEILAELVSDAVATGIPASPELGPVTDSNDAGVIPLGPAIDLEKTVAAGHGAACPGSELVTGAVGDPISYCFVVTNVGDIPLFPVVIVDPDLAIDTTAMTLISGDAATPLAPGDSLVYRYETTLATDLVNVATATGTVVDGDGTPVQPPTTVSDEDDATVEITSTDDSSQGGGSGPGDDVSDEGDDPEVLPVTGSEAGRQAHYGLLLTLAGALLVVLSRAAREEGSRP
jgi:hypothetical protein